jgi:thioredoxin-like negative regulator of GroEL
MGEKITQINKDNFEALTDFGSDSKPVLIKVSAEWCGPCKLIAPYYEQKAEELSDKIIFAELKVEGENGEIAKQLKVTSIPAFFVFKNGQIVYKSTGASKSVVDKLIEECLNVK